MHKRTTQRIAVSYDWRFDGIVVWPRLAVRARHWSAGVGLAGVLVSTPLFLFTVFCSVESMGQAAAPAQYSESTLAARALRDGDPQASKILDKVPIRKKVRIAGAFAESGAQETSTIGAQP